MFLRTRPLYYIHCNRRLIGYLAVAQSLNFIEQSSGKKDKILKKNDIQSIIQPKKHATKAEVMRIHKTEVVFSKQIISDGSERGQTLTNTKKAYASKEIISYLN